MPKRVKGRKDGNHRQIVSALEVAGCHTIDLSEHGGGLPDLIVWSRGVTYLVEIKNRENSYGKKGANSNQKRWADSWPQPVWLLTSMSDVEMFVNGRFRELRCYGSDEALRAVLGEAMR